MLFGKDANNHDVTVKLDSNVVSDAWNRYAKEGEVSLARSRVLILQIFNIPPS